jgi:hypothetical protein
MATKNEESKGISIHDFPSYSESLALNWTLSVDEIKFILNSVKGENQILYFAAQLKSLQNSGIFIELNNDPNKSSEKILHFLSKQLNISVTELSPVSKNSETRYREKIKSFLGYQEFGEKQEIFIKKFIMHEMQTDLYSDLVLQEKTRDFLKSHKIVRPAESVLSRLIASYYKESLTLLYQKLANKLTDDQKEKILQLLKKQPHQFSLSNYYKKSPPEPSAFKINIFINRYNELKELGITEIEFSDVTQAIFEKLETLGRTYDANALSNIGEPNKRIALLLCTLSAASKNILDHILEMNAKLLAKKERISKNFYENQLKKMQQQAKKGLQFILSTTKQMRSHNDPKNTTLFDFIENIDRKILDDSILACEQLSGYQSSGFYQTLENKYNDLRKYTPYLFELEFK